MKKTKMLFQVLVKPTYRLTIEAETPEKAENEAIQKFEKYTVSIVKPSNITADAFGSEYS